MSNYPPYQYQPYMPSPGPYMPPQPYPNRMDMNTPTVPQGQQNASQGQTAGIMGLSPASRPVTSREEAMGVAADFSGAPMIFPDVTHDRVYIKRWDLASGGPAFDEYARVTHSPAQCDPSPAPKEQIWASIQQLQDLQDLVDGLKTEVDRLKKPAGKGAVKSDTDK